MKIFEILKSLTFFAAEAEFLFHADLDIRYSSVTKSNMVSSAQGFIFLYFQYQNNHKTAIRSSLLHFRERLHLPI